VLADLAAHRGAVARAEALVLLNRANCSQVGRLLGRPATHVAVNRNCGNDGAPCGVGCGAAALMTTHDHHNLTGFVGLLYEGATRRTAPYFTPSHGHAVLAIFLHLCDHISLVGFAGPGEENIPSYYHAGSDKFGLHSFGKEGALRAALARCLHHPRLVLLSG
jgi:hypothetical protein